MGSCHRMLVSLSVFLLALLSSSSALQAVCTFSGEGSGQVTGEILLIEHPTPDGTEIEISGELMNLSPGEHGFHIHERGDLSDNSKGAGGHYNPFGNNHGAPGAEERHVGDLGNVVASDEMITFVRIEDHMVRLSGDNSVLNRAIVVHEGVDDLGLGGEEDSLTTGHAGARAGCCIITELPESSGPKSQ